MEKIKKANKKLIAVIAAGLILAGGYLGYNAFMFQSTDDAYVENLHVQVAPKVKGEITDVFVEDNQFVKAGSLIAKIDNRDYKIAYNLANAQYERALLNQTNAKANLSAVNSELALAKKDVERYENLFKEGAISKQTLDNAVTKYDSIKANRVSANQAILSDTENKVANAEIEALKAQRDQAKLNLEYTEIYAPQTGTVTNKRISKGTYIQTGSPMLSIVPEEVWVVANFKENQVGRMKKGQEVLIKIDTYPNKTFRGKIDSIQRLSGAKSSLFPPENAVGSFVKIVQRIPVKIVFTEEIDKSKYNIIPGMSVVPKVRVR
ncbi:MAG: HlyD family secretion protein [bacterium]|nr:HlyD family secretion protein [bacterium]